MEHAGGDKLKVIALVLRKFFDRINQGYGPFHLELAGELSKMRLMAQRQNDGSQDKAEAIALVEAIERHWDFLTGGGDNKIVAKGWSI
jgi:hypothetical protein